MQRKNVCISYKTGTTIHKNGKSYPDTRLLVVGHAFVNEDTGTINGVFRAVPPQWDGHFVILTPRPRHEQEPEPEGGEFEPPDF